MHKGFGLSSALGLCMFAEVGWSHTKPGLADLRGFAPRLCLCVLNPVFARQRGRGVRKLQCLALNLCIWIQGRMLSIFRCNSATSASSSCPLCGEPQRRRGSGAFLHPCAVEIRVRGLRLPGSAWGSVGSVRLCANHLVPFVNIQTLLLSGRAYTFFF